MVKREEGREKGGVKRGLNRIFTRRILLFVVV